MVVETYGNWWNEARNTYSCLATCLPLARLNLLKSSLVYEIFSKLNLTLTGSIMRAVMALTLIAETIFNLRFFILYIKKKKTLLS